MTYEYKIASFLNKNFEQIISLQENWSESPQEVNFKTKLLKRLAKDAGLQLDNISENFDLKFTLDEQRTATILFEEYGIKINIDRNVSE